MIRPPVETRSRVTRTASARAGRPHRQSPPIRIAVLPRPGAAPPTRSSREGPPNCCDGARLFSWPRRCSNGRSSWMPSDRRSTPRPPVTGPRCWCSARPESERRASCGSFLSSLGDETKVLAGTCEDLLHADRARAATGRCPLDQRAARHRTGRAIRIPTPCSTPCTRNWQTPSGQRARRGGRALVRRSHPRRAALRRATGRRTARRARPHLPRRRGRPRSSAASRSSACWAAHAVRRLPLRPLTPAAVTELAADDRSSIQRPCTG